MTTQKNDVFDFISDYISKSDIYAANAIAKISMFIFKRRQELGMSQKDFAKMMNVTQGMVSKWESADYNFTIESLAQISEKLNVCFDIAFSTDSEYLINNSTNEYEDSCSKNMWDVRTVINFSELAA